MRRMKQRFRHDPSKGKWGDCQRTVYACLLDKSCPEDVPHFGANGADGREFFGPLEEYLASEGLERFRILYPGELDYRQVMHAVGTMNPDCYYMLIGKSTTGCNHVVICLGDSVYWNTALDDAEIVGPVENEGEPSFYWVEILVPLRFKNQG